MDIVFQTNTGQRFQAKIVNDKLTDIKPLSPPNPFSPPSPSMGGGTIPSMGEGSTGQTSPSGQTDGTTPKLAKPNRVFVEQLKAVLVNNRARKVLRHKQRGVLDTRKLVATQLDSTSVWRQNNRKDSTRNYSVLLLVDESGSMGGEKADLSQEVVQEVVASFGEVGGVETAVLGFSGNRIVERKRFDDSGHNSLGSIAESSGGDVETALGQKIEDLVSTDHSNADLIAIEYGLHYLRKNSADRSRLVFVMLSDGAPCNSRSSINIVTADMRVEGFRSKVVPRISDSSKKTHMHTLIKRYPDVLSFGLGMLEGGDQVPRHRVVKALGDTRKELLGFLKTAVQ